MGRGTPFLFRIATILLLLLHTSCGGSFSGSDERTEERIRFLHAATGYPIVDATINGKPYAKDIAYGENTEYEDFAAGTNTFRVTSPYDRLPVIEKDISVTDDKDYTVILFEGDSGTELLSNETLIEYPDSGLFKLRVANLSNTLKSVDVYITFVDEELSEATPAFTALATKQFSNYLSLDAGDYRIRVTVNDGENIRFDSGRLRFEQDTIRTLTIMDRPGGGLPVISTMLKDSQF